MLHVYLLLKRDERRSPLENPGGVGVRSFQEAQADSDLQCLCRGPYQAARTRPRAGLASRFLSIAVCTLGHMDEKTYEETVERLRKANAVIGELDPAIRTEAFAILRPYVAGSRRQQADAQVEDENEGNESEDDTGWSGYDELIEKHESDRDHENALLALSIYYDRHGRGPMELSQVKAVATEFNLDVPKRLDKFFDRAKRDEGEVLRQQSDGWKVTPSGEKWLQKTYGVSRGKRAASETA